MNLDLLSSYDFSLPEELIAQRPVEPRDSSRLMIVKRASGEILHKNFYELPDFVQAGDLFVANNTKVFKARLLGKRATGGKVEFLMLEQISALVWEGAFHASAKHKPGVEFEVPSCDGGSPISGRIVRGASESSSGTIWVEFDRDPIAAGAGVIPLPHYITREPSATDIDTYQTIYAKEQGSAAAPTAGFHFTERVLGELKERKVTWDEITLHVGLGTFRPVKSDDIRNHVMHEEKFSISSAVAEKINKQLKQKKRIIAVGTTTVRTLESAYDISLGGLRAGSARTSIFITPNMHKFRIIDALITNFHLPKSTLFMLVCAFGGYPLMIKAYEEAVRNKYRFFSYGDSMLIL